MKMKMLRTLYISICIMILLAAMSAFALADPYGANNVTRVNDERRTFDMAAVQVDAQAGNVTELSINASVLTSHWQGYYGNISGSITLDNAAGWTLYDWSADDLGMAGEVFASNNTVSSWSDVVCVNLGGDGVPGSDGINAFNIDNGFGITTSDADGINETFTSTDDINIGTTTLSTCPATHLYVNNASQGNQWNQTLLTENSTGTVVFATEIEDNTVGFDGNMWDFQMIVADNGDITAPTPYYFYVELA